MTKKKETKEPDTFVLFNNGQGGAFIMKLDPRSGIDVGPASNVETLRAMRIAVACLNTGKSDQEIYRALEGLTS